MIHARADTTNHRTARRAIAALACVVVMCVAAVAGAADIRLRSDVSVAGPSVVLSDIAELNGDAANALRDVAIGGFKGDDRQVTLTLASVREALDKQGVNWGRVSLSGYTRCRVERMVVKAEVPATQPAEALPAAAANPNDEVDLSTRLMVRDLVVDRIAQVAGVDRGELRVVFSTLDEKVLSQSAVGERYEIEPQSASGLGRVPVVVRRWSGDSLMETGRISAEVSRRMLAVVVVKGITRGRPIAADAVAVREVFINRPGISPVTRVSEVAGQEITVSLREGQIVQTSHLRSPVVVERGDVIVVRCVSGGLVLKTSMRATEAGSIGQSISAQNEKGRDAGVRVRITAAGEGVLLSPNDSEGEKITTTENSDEGTGS